MEVEEVVEVVVDVVTVVVVVLVVGGNNVVVVVVVYIVPAIGRSTDVGQSPLDFTLTIVAPLGTITDRYPVTKDAFGILYSNGTVYASTSEYRSKGPVSEPATTNVINTVCAIY